MTVAELINELLKFPLTAEVIVLDDSTTKTPESIEWDDEEPTKVLVW